MAFTVPEYMYFNLASGFSIYQGAVTRIYTSSTPVPFSTECLLFCPKVLIHLVTRGSCQPSVTQSSFTRAGRLTLSHHPCLALHTAMCSVFYLPTDRPLPCENIFCYNCATSPCQTAAPAKYSYQSSIIWLQGSG